MGDPVFTYNVYECTSYTWRSISSKDSNLAMGASNAERNSQDSVAPASELIFECRLVEWVIAVVVVSLICNFKKTFRSKNRETIGETSDWD